MELSEEEKKAFEIIKGELQDQKQSFIYYKGVLGVYSNGEVETLLELIEKLKNNLYEEQERNECLKDKVENQQKEIEKLNFENHMLKNWNEQLDRNCISKDKIREKIAEIKNDLSIYEEIHILDVLQELLEEE